MNKAWRETDIFTFLYYGTEDGKIVGMVHRLGNSSFIYIAKVFHGIRETPLGQYIDSDHARKAVEHHWLIEDRTLTHG